MALLFAFSYIQLPMQPSEWQILKYSKIPANQVEFKQQQMHIKVRSSAGPLVHKLQVSGDANAPKKLQAFRLKLSKIGNLKAESKFPEDSYLRIGLIKKGSKRLGWMQKKLAADWVLKLYDLAPKNSGIERIIFYNINSSKLNLKESRLHPKSDLIFETPIAYWPELQESFEMEFKLPEATEVLAIWLSSDGDNTKSDFDLVIHSIELCFTDNCIVDPPKPQIQTK